MNAVVAAVGLVLVLEGIFYALFPDAMKRMAAQVITAPGDTLRIVGLVSVVLGVVVVWFSRG